MSDPMHIEGDTDASGFPIVGIGASAGGLAAIERFFGAIPPNPGMAFVVVQHLSPDFKSVMGELLQRYTTLPSHRVEQGMPVAPNAIYLIPAKMRLTVEGGRFVLTARDSGESVPHPIDVFLESLALAAGPRAVAVILSGTGSDGSQGVRRIQAAGGKVLVQSMASADYDGMPRAAAAASTPDCVETPENLARFLFGLPQIPTDTADGSEDPGDLDSTGPTLSPENLAAYQRIFDVLGRHYGLDFALYKLATVARRVERRMLCRHFTDLGAYVQQLEQDPAECCTLYKDLLIGVTRFFRDSEAFDRLAQEALPALFEAKTQRDEIRIWVAGCATGEEAYSLAMLCDEVAAALARPPRIRIFATDVHQDSIRFAAQGIYTTEQMADVSEQRRAHYFEETAQGWRVITRLRRCVVFAVHNLITDTPFTQMDLVSCRNLLIYLRPEPQDRILHSLYFALRKGGVLLLGPSETPSPIAALLTALDPHWRIYQKEGDRPASAINTRHPVAGHARSATVLQRQSLLSNKNRLERAIRHLVDHLVPSGFLITAQRELLYTFGEAGRFLAPRGPASADLIDQLQDDLRTTVGNAIQRALQSGAPVIFERIRIASAPAEYHRVAVEPVQGSGQGDALLFVRIEHTRTPAVELPLPDTFIHDDAVAGRIADLERELQEARENLQTTVEELETTNEELQATNEELLAANEELQSTNEELQSVNEELHTVNAEYERKNEELLEVNSDLNNLFECTEIGTIFLDKALCIRKFTPSIRATFNLRPQDLGRPFIDIAPLLLAGDRVLLELVQQVLETGQVQESEVHTTNGAAFLQRIHPYHDAYGQIMGVALTFVDLKMVQEAEERLIAAERFRVDVLNSISANVAVLNAEGTIIATNDAWLQFAADNAAIHSSSVEVGANYFGACVCASDDESFGDAQKATAGIKGVLSGRLPQFEMEYPCHAPNEERWFLMRVTPLNTPETGAVVTHINVTSLKRMQQEIAIQEHRYRSLYHNTPVGLYRCRLDGALLDFNDRMLAITGHPSREIFAGAFAPLAFGDPGAPDNLEHRLQTEGRVENLVTRLQRVDGTQLWLSINATSVADAPQDRTVFDVSVSDITAQKAIEADLIAAQSASKQLAAAVNAAAESILITDVRGTIEYVNPAFCEVSGYTAAEVLGNTPALLKSGEQAPDFYMNLWNTILSGKPWSGQFVNRRKNGEFYTVRGTIAPVLNADGRITQFVGVMRDVTQQEALERQLRQTQKLEAIGTLAGGIAHDFNNILAAIQGYSELAQDSLPADSEARHDLAQVLKASYRATELVRQILTFSRRTEESRQAVELRLIVDEALKLLRASLPANIEIRADVARDGATVLADPTQLHQVVMNLCTNAHHAMRETGGVLGVHLYTTSLDAASAATFGVEPGEFLVLEVSDTGAGMDNATIERVFEPFFSTKGTEGTGMGLSIVHGVVKACGGAIVVRSKLREGTHFTIYLPRAMHLDEPGRSDMQDAQSGAGTERILIVDDEPGLVSLLCRVLTQNGYHPVGVSDSREALRLVESDPNGFDLVVTDQTMPVLLGVDLALGIWAVAPKLPIILTSGFSENVTPEDAIKLGFSAFLSKPVSLPRLTREIRLALDARHGAA